MRDIDFIRQLIDFIDSRRGSFNVTPAPDPDEQDTKEININVNDGGDGDDVETPMDRDDVFIPPLQAKLEIMKLKSELDRKTKVYDQFAKRFLCIFVSDSSWGDLQ